jgi:hypothetical protein
VQTVRRRRSSCQQSMDIVVRSESGALIGGGEAALVANRRRSDSVTCHPALLELQKQSVDMEMIAKFYLRGISATFIKTLPEIGLARSDVCDVALIVLCNLGWRSVFEKAFYLTKSSSGEGRVLELMDASKTALPLESDAKRVSFQTMLANMRHPFLHNADTDTVEYCRDKDQLAVFSAVAKCGSVKDRIYDIAAPLHMRYATKYGTGAVGRPLSQVDDRECDGVL